MKPLHHYQHYYPNKPQSNSLPITSTFISQSFVEKTPIYPNFQTVEEELSESLSIYDNKSQQRESLSNIDDTISLTNLITPLSSSSSPSNEHENSILFQNKCTFIQTYLTLLKQTKQSTYPSLLKFSLKANVRDYILTEDHFFNYVKYIIDGTLNDKSFQVSRRYKEFISYRSLLVENWPGLFIPQIPPKKTFGNLEDAFIHLRQNFLQVFFNKISSCPHLASSLETKIFLEPRTENYSELPLEIYHRNIEDIYKIYSNYFNFLNEITLTQKQKTSLQQFYIILNQTKTRLENLNYIITEAKNIQMETEALISNFNECNYMTENSYFDMMNFNKKQINELNKPILEVNIMTNLYESKSQNFYTTYFEWVNSVLIDTEAMIEAMSCLYKYNKIFEEKIEILKQLNELLFRSTNRSYFKDFFFQLDLNKVQNIIYQVKTVKEEIEVYKKLIDLIYKILFFIEIPTYKKDQYNYYIAFIKKVISDEKHSEDKNKNIYKLMMMHCNSMMEIMKKGNNEEEGVKENKG